MSRLTVNKPVQEMKIIELAHNSCFAKDGKAMYRDYDTVIDAREFVRNLIKCRGLINLEDEIFHNDDAFDEFMTECLVIDPRNEIGFIAFVYRGLWAQADLHARLKHFEDLQESGRLPELPCKVGDTLYRIDTDCSIDNTEIEPLTIENIVILKNGEVLFRYDAYDGIICNLKSLVNGELYLDFYRTFLTREEAESTLKRMKGGTT